ncbi:MAG: sigma-70 family RNA polymerase sigma factor [Phycisphaerae bacterium]
MTEPTQQQIEKAVAGDANALSEILAVIGPQIERQLQINPIWQNVLEPADVMQVTYLESFLRIGTFDPARGTPIAAWLRRIAENNLKDAIRGLERQKQPQPKDRIRPARYEDSLIGLYNILGTDSTTPSRNVRQAEATKALEAAIADLPERYREVLQMYDIDGRPIQELVEATGRSAGAIHMLRARAHDRLRESLGTASKIF